MEITAFIEELGRLPLSRGSQIWTDSSKTDFQESVARWTDVHKKELSPIILSAADGNIVEIFGFILSTIGGAITALAPLVGYGYDNIVSARMVKARGTLSQF
ncbi:hypothetical protein AAE478_006250 [Parahypoxylon ruwenzoriense]